MAAQAVGFSRAPGRDASSAEDVLSKGDELYVLGVNATTNAAEVVRKEPWRDRPVDQLKGQSVRWDEPTPDGQPPVTVAD
jgi:hypothetical protein